MYRANYKIRCQFFNAMQYALYMDVQYESLSIPMIAVAGIYSTSLIAFISEYSIMAFITICWPFPLSLKPCSVYVLSSQINRLLHLCEIGKVELCELLTPGLD